MAQATRRKENEAQANVRNTANGTIYLIIIQLASRALTFAGNQFVLRYLSPKLLGIAVQFELYSVSVLYFSRESLRVALQRLPLGRESLLAEKDKPISGRQTQLVVNLSFLAIGLGIPLTVGLGWLYYVGQSSNVQVHESPYFTLSLQLYAVATLIELLSEPCFVVIQERLLYRARAGSETTAAVSKCAATCLVAFLAGQMQLKPSVLPFAIGQTAYAIVLASGYLATVLPLARHDGFSMLPTVVENSTENFMSRFYRPLVLLAGTLYAQSVFKQVLSQGDGLILGFLASLEDQGAFALASNYGGLIARLLFQPIEESSRNAFGKKLSTVDNVGKVDSRGLQGARQQLIDMLHLYSIIAVLSSCFLYTVLPVFVKLLVGPAWFTPEIASILSTYCYYIPFMAYNGILDAFVTSVATSAELNQQSLWMGAFTAAYLAAAYLLLNVLHLGAQGLVLGNIFNMLLRVLWSSWFIARYMRKNNAAMSMTKAIMPSTGVFLVGTVAAGVMRRMDVEGKTGVTGMLDVLVVCAVGGSIILFLERDFLLEYISSVVPERLASTFNARRRRESKAR